MTPPRSVALNLRCRAAWPGLPPALPVGSIFTTDGGELLRVVEAGRIEPVHQGGAPFGRSAASDPAAAGWPRRTS